MNLKDFPSTIYLIEKFKSLNLRVDVFKSFNIGIKDSCGLKLRSGERIPAIDILLYRCDHKTPLELTNCYNLIFKSDISASLYKCEKWGYETENPFTENCFYSFDQIFNHIRIHVLNCYDQTHVLTLMSTSIKNSKNQLHRIQNLLSQQGVS